MKIQSALAIFETSFFLFSAYRDQLHSNVQIEVIKENLNFIRLS